MRAHTLAEFESNLKRAKNLVRVYESLGASGKGRRAVGDADVLRAAVVFTHSSLEELFRNLFRWKLPTEAPPGILDKIPLKGSREQEKFQLGKLATFRHEFVENVIKQSIDAYCDVLNVNSSYELAKNIEMIGLKTAQFDAHFARLESLFARRHQIVHQADKNSDAGSGNHKARSLSVTQVQTWIRHTEEFVHALVAAVPENSNLPVDHEIRERARNL